MSGPGRTRQLSISPGMSPEMLRLISEQRGINKEFDRRKPVTSPTVFNNDASRPPARDNPGRIIFVRQADGSLRGQYSDGSTWQTFLATAVSFATPAITYGTAYAAGSASTTIRSDATLKFPRALMSTANSATVTLTDNAVDSTLTASLGNFIFVAGGTGGLVFDVDAASASIVSATVRIRPGSGNTTGLQTSYFAGDVATTMRAWDAAMSAFSGKLTAATIVGYDASSFSVTAPATSSGTNNMYGIRFANFQITNTNATWGVVATAYFRGVHRSLSSPTITTQVGVIVEPPTAATSDQIGILIRQQTAQATAGVRYGLKIDAQNSGTVKYAIHAITDQSYFGKLLQDDSVKHVFGTGLDAELYYDGTDFVADPDVVGAGSFDIRGPLKCDSITNDTGLAAGAFVPVRSAEANMDANVTMSEGQYLRVGNTVTMSGRFIADPTLTATATSFEMTLPVASNIGAAEDLAGVAFCGNIAGMGAEIIGSVANNTAVVQWVASDITSKTWAYTYTYAVI